MIIPDVKILNLCSGTNKITGTWNVDLNPAGEPDEIVDILKPFPWPDDTFSTVFFFHAIEHIVEAHHDHVLREIWRVLEPGGEVLISYPEFRICAQNYIDNVKGDREFWKKTIYGRQLSQWDFHVSLMDSQILVEQMAELGFKDLVVRIEPKQVFNSVLHATKGPTAKTYEEIITKEILNVSG